MSLSTHRIILTLINTTDAFFPDELQCHNISDGNILRHGQLFLVALSVAVMADCRLQPACHYQPSAIGLGKFSHAVQNLVKD